MALTGSQKAYLQARSGIARSGAIRSNYVFPLYGVVTVNGLDITESVRYGSLKVTMALNDQPDTASFELLVTDPAVDAAVQVGYQVQIGLGGPTENLLFGGRILTMQTTCGPGQTPWRRSVMCADFLQVLDSEYLITYDWPAQSATTTIYDVVTRFFNRPGGESLYLPDVGPPLPSHAAFAVANERFSTVMRRLVTLFPDGGGFYVDPLKVLHVWTGAAEPNQVNPQPLTLANPTLKAFAETVDGAQVRDAVIVEGRRTTAPIGSPGPHPSDATGRNLYSLPVVDASILDRILDAGVYREVRIGTQRVAFLHADGPWSSPAGAPTTTVTTAEVTFNPDPGVESNTVTIGVASTALVIGRLHPWIQIDQQYLDVISSSAGPPAHIKVPRTGFGSLTGPIPANATVTVIDSLSAGYVTNRYDGAGTTLPPPYVAPLEQLRPQPIGADVVMTVRATSAPALHEHLVQDGRYARTGALNRSTEEVADFSAPLRLIDFETEDLNARPGRLQAYTLAQPPLAPMTGQYMILSAEIAWPVWGQPPRVRCRAAKVLAANVMDTLLTDQR